MNAPWRDPSRSVEERTAALIAAMTTEEKVAQLYGVWIAASNDGAEVAPNQNEMTDPIDLDELLPRGPGQLTRPFGTKPVDPAVGAISLLRTQERIVSASRLGIPAIAHDECLAGFAAWGATAYPVPLAWGATFSPELVRKVGEHIARDMRSVGVHQGLAPVLDVVRDARWGRVEETIGEDPYLVGTIATAYVSGLESGGVIATLKHFAGYSASRAGRNLAPVSMGPRELADVILPPFEMAIRESGVRSVMNSYTDLDGVPAAADPSLLTELLRGRWGFEGTVVADYFSIGFLHTLHGVAADFVDAARLALEAGIDVELPSPKSFGPALVAAIEDGRVDASLIDRALTRVLRQKIELGLLDPGAGFPGGGMTPVPPVLAGRSDASADEVRGSVDLDPPSNRALARELAERSIVLLRNDGVLPLSAPRRVAIVGPTGEDPFAVLGCYSFPLHVGQHHSDVPIGIELPTLAESVRAEFPDAEVVVAEGTSIAGGETDGIEDAVALARSADVVIVALGDRAGLFGNGTSGEGCDVADLSLPGAQQQLLDAVIASGTPTVAVLLAGRPYCLGAAAGAGPAASTDGTGAANAIIEAFFAGEEGTPAISGVLSGRVNPSGRLPVSIPSSPGVQPSTYLAARLGQRTNVSNLDPTPAFWFGHGLSYSTFAWTDASASATEWAGEITVGVTVTNTSDRDGAEVVQLYLSDPHASIVRPMRQLIAYARVELAAGESRRVAFRVPEALTSFTGRDLTRIVEPGEIVLSFGRSAGDIVAALSTTLTGRTRPVPEPRPLHADVTISAV